MVFFAVSYSKEEITFQWSSIFTEEADKNKRDEKGREGSNDDEIIVSDQPSSDAVHLVQVCTEVKNVQMMKVQNAILTDQRALAPASSESYFLLLLLLLPITTIAVLYTQNASADASL